MNKLAQDIRNAVKIKLANLAALREYAPEIAGGALGGIGGYAMSGEDDSGLEAAGKSGIGALLGALMGHGGSRLMNRSSMAAPTMSGDSVPPVQEAMSPEDLEFLKNLTRFR